MGAAWIDYIVADEFVIPAASEVFYSEKIARLPYCFQVNDERRLPPACEGAWWRDAAGLPENAVVLCAFSNSYKLNPRTFESWLQVMSAAPDCVLWLLGDSTSVRSRLCTAAEARGIRADRLVFAERLPYAAHLARLPLADLFLDTLPFNAGATASDALWAGVPVLTCAGESFAARMAASLIRAAGMPELITTDLSQYQQLATALASDRLRLRALRQKLSAGKAHQPLFDGGRYCHDLETAFQLMWARRQRDEHSESFSVN